MTPGWLLSLGGVCLAASVACATARSRAWLVLTLAGTAAAFGAALLVLTGVDPWEWRGASAVAGELPHLRLDALSALFLVPLAVVGAAGAVYSREYWAERRASAGRGRAWWSALLLSMGLVLVSANGLHFLVAWEAFAISGYFLITLDRESREARSAGWLYLAASHAGTLGLFAFFSGLAAGTGSWDLHALHEHGELAPLFWTALFGFGVKAGFFPLHVWLPPAHAGAPSHVSAIMSGVAIKMGVYGIVRFSGWLPLPAEAGAVLLALGAASAVLGIGFAVVQHDLKRLLAYCSVENVGIILVGVGAALVAATHGSPPWGRLALAGALLHVWNHAAFKALLFLGAGSVLHATGTREMSRLGGLGRAMPWTAGLFVLGSLAVCGLPPLNGFVSEWMVYLGLFEAASGQGPAAWTAAAAAILLAGAGAVALATFAKAGAIVFLGSPRTRAAVGAHDPGPLMRGPMLALAGACATLGVVPVVFWPAVSRAVGAWHPAWSSPAPPAPLNALGAFQIALMLAGLAGAVGLGRMARRNGVRRGPTWDCGYAAPTARMQYTSGSFAAVLGGWFAPVSAAGRTERRPRGPFPRLAHRVERVPDVVMVRLLQPAAGGILQVASRLRLLQHGRLPSYILYIVAGLAALAAYVFLGVAR